VLAVTVCIALGLFAAVMTVFGRLLGMASDVCTDSRFRCSDGPIVSGSLVAAYGPLLVGGVTIVLLVVLWDRLRWTSPLALIGAAAAYGVVVLGQALIDAGIVRG
jgi:uncharacterized membrane protein